MNITKIEFNWHGLENYGFCECREVGIKGVKSIVSHFAQGEGDKCYWTVEFEDGRNEQIFNICKVDLV